MRPYSPFASVAGILQSAQREAGIASTKTVWKPTPPPEPMGLDVIGRHAAQMEATKELVSERMSALVARIKSSKTPVAKSIRTTDQHHAERIDIRHVIRELAEISQDAATALHEPIGSTHAATLRENLEYAQTILMELYCSLIDIAQRNSSEVTL